MRRENKLYSYKDQLAELELRKELEKKKGRSAAKEEPKLSKKQQEMVDDTLKRESDVRARMKQVSAPPLPSPALRVSSTFRQAHKVVSCRCCSLQRFDLFSVFRSKTRSCACSMKSRDSLCTCRHAVAAFSWTCPWRIAVYSSRRSARSRR